MQYDAVTHGIILGNSFRDNLERMIELRKKVKEYAPDIWPDPDLSASDTEIRALLKCVEDFLDLAYQVCSVVELSSRTR